VCQSRQGKSTEGESTKEGKEKAPRARAQDGKEKMPRARAPRVLMKKDNGKTTRDGKEKTTMVALHIQTWTRTEHQFVKDGCPHELEKIALGLCGYNSPGTDRRMS